MERKAKTIHVNLNMAQDFISILFGDESVTFQTFDDNRDTKKNELTRVLHGQFKDHNENLIRLNESGAGIFFMPNIGDGKGRRTTNVVKVNCVYVDLDGTPLQPVEDFILRPHIIVESSPGRYHAYWLINDCQLQLFKPLQVALIKQFNSDPAVKDLPHVMRVPGFFHRKDAPFMTRIITINDNRTRYSAADFQRVLLVQAEMQSDGDKAWGKGMIPKGARNDTLFRKACSFFTCRLGEEEVWNRLLEINEQKCLPPLQDEELNQILANAQRYHPTGQKSSIAAKGRERFTDQGNAERLIDQFGDVIRYVPAFKKWLIYDGIRWNSDSPGGPYPLVQATITTLYQKAMSLDAEDRASFLKKIIQLEDIRSQKHLVEMASTFRSIIIQPSQLDNDTYLLNLKTGTLNLRTGTLAPNSPYDYITKVAIHPFDPMAKCPTWECFLHRIMGGNEMLIRYLQKAVGYSLTGDTSEQCFFFLHGNGANGKSTFLNTILALLNDYAMQSPSDLLMTRDRSRGGPSPELARLAGVRFVATSETEEGHRFAESSLKQLTGQDVIAARNLYGDYFEYKPQFKIWLAANHKPVVRGTDYAIWRRIHLIPFTTMIPEEEQDRQLESKLQKELPGILNWAIKGCLAWQENGLKPPIEVTTAVQVYREDMDILGQWLRECCVEDVNATVAAASFYEIYKSWAMANFGFSMSLTSFGTAITDRGIKKSRNNHGRIYLGIRLKQ